jgi:hypothetical protein
MDRSVGQPARRAQRVIWGQVRLEKNYLGGLTRKISAWRAPRLIPTGAGDHNGLAPAVLEAVDRYMKPQSANFLVIGFPPGRAIRRRLHLLHQISITIALSRILGESLWHIADLSEVHRTKIWRARFQAYGKGVNGTFGRWHDASKRLNTSNRKIRHAVRATDMFRGRAVSASDEKLFEAASRRAARTGYCFRQGPRFYK